MKFSEKDCIVDVGSNFGLFTVEIARANPTLKIVAFEPVPELCRVLETICESEDLTNVIIVNKALGLHEGMATLNISQHDDQGVSSLMTFNQENIESNPYWQSRKDLYFDGSIQVEVARLDSEVKRLGFNRVVFVKIDAQGLDLDILESGSGVEIVAGMLELASASRNCLYQDEPAMQEAFPRLTQMGFEVTSVRANDPASVEFNVGFSAEKPMNEIEEALGLLGLEIYALNRNSVVNENSKLGIDKAIILSLERLENQTHGLSQSLAKERKINKDLWLKLQRAAEVERRLFDEKNSALAALSEILNSGSWKITKPIRGMLRVLRRITWR